MVDPSPFQIAEPEDVSKVTYAKWSKEPADLGYSSELIAVDMMNENVDKDDDTLLEYFIQHVIKTPNK